MQQKAFNFFQKKMFSFEYFFFKKIKFKGKGFRLRIKKKKKVIKFFFGHSHINMLFLKNVILKKTNKYKFILKSTNTEKLNIIVKKILKIKPINVFTNRGIRCTRQKIYKRKGKKGSYI